MLSIIPKGHPVLSGGIEPSTLSLEPTRSSPLSYESNYLNDKTALIIKNIAHPLSGLKVIAGAPANNQIISQTIIMCT